MTDANRQTLVDHLENDREALVLHAVDAQYERHPEIWEKYGERGRQFSLRDQGFLYDYLSEALARDDDSLFTDYATWLKVLFENLGFPASSIADHLECSREALQQTLPADVAAPGVALLDKALETVSDAPTSLPTYLPDDLPLVSIDESGWGVGTRVEFVMQSGKTGTWVSVSWSELEDRGHRKQLLAGARNWEFQEVSLRQRLGSWGLPSGSWHVLVNLEQGKVPHQEDDQDSGRLAVLDRRRVSGGLAVIF